MPAVLLFGEAFQRKEKAKEIIAGWREKFQEPELYRLEAAEIAPDEFNQHLSSNSLFSRSKIIHLTHLEEAEDPEKLASSIEGADLDSTGLVLESESIDKNSSLYRGMKDLGEVKEFEEVNKKNFPKFLKEFADRKDLSLDSKARRWMIRVMEPDLVRLDNELDKLKDLKEDGPITEEEAREVVWTGGRGDLFDFLDAFSDREIKKSLKLLRELLESGEEEGKIFYMLAREIRMLLSAKDLSGRGLAKKEMASKMGTYSWLAGKKSSQAENFSRGELISFLRGMKDKDREVKTGKSNYNDALLGLVMESCKSKVR